MKKIGLVLSGGGSRGFAHLGAIKALQEAKISPSIISGSSAGALVGALICAGYSPDYISEIIQEKGIFRSLKVSFSNRGLFSMKKVEELVKEFIPHNSFEKLKTPLVVCAVNIKKGEERYFNKGELIKPVLASCSIPGIFLPVTIEGSTFIDGGIMNNLPVEPIENLVDLIIGIDVMPIENSMPISSAKEIIMKCLMMAVGRQSLEKKSKFDLFIQPNSISKFNALSIKKAGEMFKLGYESTKFQIDKHANLFT